MSEHRLTDLLAQRALDVKSLAASYLPEGWKSIQLGEVFRERKAKGREGLPVASVSIEHGLVLRSVLDRRIHSDLPPEGHSLVCKGDIAYNMMRMWQGACGLAQADCIISPAYVVMTPTEDIEPQFAHIALRSELAMKLLHGYSQGIVDDRLRLYPDAFAQVPISLPPIDEQRRIADVLRSVDEAIAANDDLLNGIKGAKQATMEAVLSGDFAEVRLETLLADTRYPMRSGPFGSALLKSELQPEGVPFLGIDNVHVERFVPVYRRFVSEEKYRELSRYTVYPGDVMVTIMGTVGRCCVVPPDVSTAISSKHVWTLTIDQDRYSPALLAWQINHSPSVLGQLQGSAQGGIMSAISSSTLRDLMVPLPSPAEVRKVVDLLLSFNAQIAALEDEQEAATTLKAALTSDLLTGHVRVPV